MKEILNCKKINSAIRRAKKRLIEKAKKNGLYENFGDEEWMAIEDKFIDISLSTKEENAKRDKLNAFFDWCINYDLYDLKMDSRRLK